jgi:hypothetical protein
MVRFRRSRVASAAAILSATCAAAWLNALAASSAPPVPAPAPGHQHAHVHGVARMGIAVQGRTLTIQLESPLDSLIGFEHRAVTPAQTTAVSALQAKMRAPQDLFRFDVAAGCAPTKSEAESAIFQPAVAGVAAADEHADLDASFEFRCASPAQLKTLEVGLFEAFPRLKRLDVDVATDKGQFKRDLKSPQRTISLVR